MGVRLTYGSNVVDLPNPSVPYKAYDKPKQKLIETEGGQRYVYDYGVKRKVFELSWNVLNQTLFTQLQNFIENIVNFREVVFTYKDFNNISYNVRCMYFSHEQISPVHYRVSLKLEEEV